MNTELKRFLDEHIQNNTDMSKITVFPLCCGVGKSNYVKYAIADALQNRKGLIVVTDEVKRLNDYVNPQNEQLAEYIKKNINRISILTGETLSEETKTLYYKPVVLMTTQRFFDLTRNEIMKFTTGQKHRRDRIIFDEKIYLLESKKITVKTLNEIDTALDEELDNTTDSQEKQWLLSQFRIFSSKLKKMLERNEQLNIDTSTYKRESYFDSNGLTISNDDDKFYSLIEKYKPYLRKYNSDASQVVYRDVFGNIQAIRKLLSEGTITSQKIKNKNDKQEYGNYFTVVLNHSDKLIDIGAKVFVLDGTASISPEYALKCVDMVDCSRFNPDLKNLTINLVDVNTSKTKLTDGSSKTDHLLKTIIDYVKAQPHLINTIFTYKAIEDVFNGHFENINHFGDIRGTNEYRNERFICQIGLHRYSEFIYMLFANEIGRFNDGIETFKNRIYDKETIDRIRCQMILADIEQNLFRCKIRNYDNKDSCIYTLICNVNETNKISSEYHPLLDMIKERYEKYGATVNLIDTPMEFRLLKTKERNQDTYEKRILAWLESNGKGYVFKIDTMLESIGITQKQFQNIKNKNSAIKEMFKQMRISRGIYKIV